MVQQYSKPQQSWASLTQLPGRSKAEPTLNEAKVETEIGTDDQSGRCGRQAETVPRRGRYGNTLVKLLGRRKNFYRAQQQQKQRKSSSLRRLFFSLSLRWAKQSALLMRAKRASCMSVWIHSQGIRGRRHATSTSSSQGSGLLQLQQTQHQNRGG